MDDPTQIAKAVGHATFVLGAIPELVLDKEWGLVAERLERAILLLSPAEKLADELFLGSPAFESVEWEEEEDD